MTAWNQDEFHVRVALRISDAIDVVTAKALDAFWNCGVLFFFAVVGMFAETVSKNWSN
jgi:hypothetical protein